MIGMRDVSNQVDSLIAQGVYNRRREANGLPVTNGTKHMVFVGNPGTGKTEVARKIAPLYEALGLTPDDVFVAPKKSELIGSVLGETQKLIQEQFEKARGGVLFIDEAYALVEGKQDMYGKQAVNTLLELMENHRDDTVVILAGYPDEMAAFLDENPGMRSRIGTTINFPDYSDKDKYQIAGKFLHDEDYKTDEASWKLLRSAIRQYTSEGNARSVRNIVAKIKEAHVLRTAFDETADLTRITSDDVQMGVQQYVATLPPRQKVSA